MTDSSDANSARAPQPAARLGTLDYRSQDPVAKLERNDATAGRYSHPAARPRTLDYRGQIPLVKPEPFGWRDIAVILLILSAPLLLWLLLYVSRI